MNMAGRLTNKRVVVGVLTLVLIVIGTILYNSKARGLVELPKEINLKEVRLSDKPIFSFIIKNTSSRNMEIARIYTSCGCTTVLEPTGSFQVNPESSANIKMQFDPSSMHKVGDVFYHEIYVLTTKPAEKEFVVKIKGNII